MLSFEFLSVFIESAQKVNIYHLVGESNLMHLLLQKKPVKIFKQCRTEFLFFNANCKVSFRLLLSLVSMYNQTEENDRKC